MKHEVGQRVGAMLCADKDTVQMLGYGIYSGEEIPPAGITMMGIDMNEIGHSVPKLLLDNGDVVWGCECWWGGEAKVRSAIAGRKVVEVRIQDVRKKAS